MYRNYVNETTGDRDNYRKRMLACVDLKVKLEKEKLTMIETFKKRVMEQDRDMKNKQDEATTAIEAKFALEKEKKNWFEERDKMKERIKKLKSKRGKFDAFSKTCKFCAKDYNEKENFNWSCRIHQGVWSGELWWCCGKDQKDQPGCKYSKHESKEDEEMEEIGNTGKQVKKMRCLCCKEVGHLIEHCPRDPNLRSQADTEQDY